MPDEQPLEWIAGDANEMLITVTDPETANPDTGYPGDPLPLPLGSKVWLYAKRSLQDADADAVVALDSDGAGIAIIDRDGGIALATIPLPALEGQPYYPRSLYYAVQVLTPDGGPWEVQRGVANVTRGVVRATA